MEGHQPRASAAMIVVLIVGAVGLGLTAVGVTGPSGWTLLAPGLAAVVFSLLAAAYLEREQTRAASRTRKPKR
jgi:hypothetical protein